MRRMDEKDRIQVSVIVPVYHVLEAYLRECIESILSQTFRSLELIAVDDGSTAENAGLLDAYARKDPRMHVIHQENRGVSAARNKGLETAAGKYVTFVDSDDVIDPTALETVFMRAEEDALEVLLWGDYRIFPHRKEKHAPFVEDIRLLGEKEKECLELKAFVGDLPMYEYPASRYGSGSCCCKLYRLDFLIAHHLRYPVGIERSEDVNFNLRVFEAADRIGYLNAYLYDYRQLPDSASYQYRDGGIEVYRKALKLMKEFVTQHRKPDYFMQAYYMRCMFFFLESMDMDYLHPKNRKSIFFRIGEMRRAAKTDPYQEAFAKLKYSNLTFAKRIPLFLIRSHLMGTLMLFYAIYRKM